MSAVSVLGYLDGVSYILEADDSVPADALSGIITRAPGSLVTDIESRTGEQVRLHSTGVDHAIGVDTIEGILAYLTTYTEVTDMTGDLPEDITGSDDDRVDAVQ